ALAGVVVVSTALLGLYLTEVGFLSLKVQEASSHAVYDATGRKLDDYANPDSPQHHWAQLLDDTSSAATRKYSDFDGVLGTAGGRTMMFTRGQGLQVQCEQSTGGG